MKFVTRFCFALVCTLVSAITVADEIKLKYARQYLSDLSGSCDVCATFNGVIEVKNIAPEKDVIVHYVGGFTNSWTTVDAQFIGPSRPGYEYWSFSTGMLGGAVEFALEYIVNGVSHWDNNQQANYVISQGSPLIEDSATQVLLSRNEKPLIFNFTNAIAYSGTVHLRNLGFEKIVTVRYSTDGWQTWQDTTASFTNTESNGLERWSFGIQLPKGSETLDVAVAYTVNDETYWDNNLGRNYTFELPQ